MLCDQLLRVFSVCNAVNLFSVMFLWHKICEQMTYTQRLVKSLNHFLLQVGLGYQLRVCTVFYIAFLND